MKQENFTKQLIAQIGNLTTYAQSYSPTIEDAEDLLQDTLLLMLEHSNRYVDNNFGGWAYRVLTNLHRNRIRRHRAIIGEVNDNAQRIGQCDTNDEKYDLARAITLLSPSFRETMTMMLEGYEYNEIARQLNISPGTVKSRIHRAKQQLRNRLKEYK